MHKNESVFIFPVMAIPLTTDASVNPNVKPLMTNAFKQSFGSFRILSRNLRELGITAERLTDEHSNPLLNACATLADSRFTKSDYDRLAGFFVRGAIEFHNRPSS